MLFFVSQVYKPYLTPISETKDIFPSKETKEPQLTQPLPFQSPLHAQVNNGSLPNVSTGSANLFETNVQIEKVEGSTDDLKRGLTTSLLNNRDETNVELKAYSEKDISAIANTDAINNTAIESCEINQDVVNTDVISSTQNSSLPTKCLNTANIKETQATDHPAIPNNLTDNNSHSVPQVNSCNEKLKAKNDNQIKSGIKKIGKTKSMKKKLNSSEKDLKKSIKIFRISSLPAKLKLPNYKNNKTYIQQRAISTCESSTSKKLQIFLLKYNFYTFC